MHRGAWNEIEVLNKKREKYDLNAWISQISVWLLMTLVIIRFACLPAWETFPLSFEWCKIEEWLADREVDCLAGGFFGWTASTMAEMVVVSVFTFERISIFKFLQTSVRVILNALLLTLRDHNPSHSWSPLGTDHHSHLLTFSWSLRELLIKFMLRIWWSKLRFITIDCW